MSDAFADRPLWRPVFGQVGQRVEQHQSYGWDNRERSEGFAVVQLTRSGQLLHRDAAGLECQAGPGQGMVFLHGEATWYGLPPPPRPVYLCDWVALEGAGVREHLGAAVRRFGPVFTADEALSASLHRLVEQRAGDLAEPAAAAAATHGFVLQLWGLMERRHLAARTPVERAVEAILADPWQPWTLKEWAHRHGVSREHLCRSFVQRTGQPPARWIASRRRERARLLVGGSSLGAREICRLIGVGSRHTLGRLLRHGAT
ncbi:MAG: AraC family transcriptional regulator [Planctomycetes bacterium]|nr:AraC family transcriptional regulator [Planctomycetota bacterium]